MNNFIKSWSKLIAIFNLGFSDSNDEATAPVAVAIVAVAVVAVIVAVARFIQIAFKSITFELNIIHVVWVNTTNYN